MAHSPQRLGLVFLMLLALGLAACGKKAPLKVPKEDRSAYTYPQAYPDPDTVVPQSSATEEENVEQELDEVGVQSRPLVLPRSTTTTYGAEP